MNSRWTAHIKDKEEKKKFSSMVKSCSIVIERLKDMLEDDCNKSTKRIRSKKFLDDNNLTERIVRELAVQGTLSDIIEKYLTDKEDKK